MSNRNPQDPQDPQDDPQNPQNGVDPNDAEAVAAAENSGAAEEEDGLFSETVTLPDGEQVVFEAETQEELREKILSGFGEALAKSKQVPGTPSTPVTPTAKQKKQLSQDEEFAIKAEFTNGNPVKGIEKLFQLKYGKSIDDVVEAAERGGDVAHRTERFAREQSAVIKFRDAHPEYVGSKKNEAAFNLYLAGREATPELLNEAYKHLTAQELLDKEAPKGTPGANPADPANPGNPNPPEPPRRKSAGSGLWGRPGAGAPRTQTKKGLSEAEIQKIATEQGPDALLAALEDDFKAANSR